MKIIVFRRADSNELFKYETMQSYFDRGKTYEQIESAVQKYNTTPNETTAEIVDAESILEEIVNFNSASCELLPIDYIIHPATECIPKGTYIYEFKKHPKHSTLAMNLLKVGSDGVRLPELNRKDEGMLPVAWCHASELQERLGFTKKNIRELYTKASTLAWSWWEEE